jgi:hypothetical protein
MRQQSCRDLVLVTPEQELLVNKLSAVVAADSPRGEGQSGRGPGGLLLDPAVGAVTQGGDLDPPGIDVGEGNAELP